MSRKYDAFKAALIELCKAHDVQLSTGGYDRIVVSDLSPDPHTSEPIYYGDDGIEDNTSRD